MGQGYTSLHQNLVITRTRSSVATGSMWLSSQTPRGTPRYGIGTDGSGLRQLTFDAVDDLLPSINYDGSVIVYQTTINGYSQIMVVNTSTGEIDQLTNNQDNNFSPSIDGTGSHVAFQGNVAGFTQLFLAIQVSGTVGGASIPANRFALLAPFLVTAAVVVLIGGVFLYAQHWCKTDSQAFPIDILHRYLNNLARIRLHRSKRRNNSAL